MNITYKDDLNYNLNSNKLYRKHIDIQMSRGFNEASDVLKLKKELGHARAQIQDLQDELTEKTNLYIKAISVSDLMSLKLVMLRTETSTVRS